MTVWVDAVSYGLAAIRGWRRREPMKELAKRLQLTYHESGLTKVSGHAENFLELARQDDLIHALIGLPLLNEGIGHEARRVCLGEVDGHQTYCFDLRSIVDRRLGLWRPLRFIEHSVVAFRLPIMLPIGHVWPRALSSGIGKQSNLEVELESFNHSFGIHTTDRKTMLNLLCPKVLEVMSSGNPYRWDLCGPYLVVSASGWSSPSVFEEMVSMGIRVIKEVPPFLMEDHGFPMKYARAAEGF